MSPEPTSQYALRAQPRQVGLINFFISLIEECNSLTVVQSSCNDNSGVAGNSKELFYVLFFIDRGNA